MIWLKLSLVAALLLNLGFFIFYFFKLYSFYRSKPQARPRGDIRKGKIYSLTIGLLPWEKESTKKHWPVYITGIIYHLAIALAFFRLLEVSLDWQILSNQLVMFFLLIGAICGFVLLFRRLLRPELRQLSLPDDYLANLLVDLFLLTSAISISYQGTIIYFLLISLILILYLPLGKIRHCIFFIPSRLIFGHYYGLRGVLPPPPLISAILLITPIIFELIP